MSDDCFQQVRGSLRFLSSLFLFPFLFFPLSSAISLTHTIHMSSCFTRKTTVTRRMFNVAQQGGSTEPKHGSYFPQTLQFFLKHSYTIYVNHIYVKKLFFPPPRAILGKCCEYTGSALKELTPFVSSSTVHVASSHQQSHPPELCCPIW